MEIHVNRGQDRSGPYSLEKVREYMAEGVMLPDDLAWHEGLEGWISLRELTAETLDAPTPAPLPHQPLAVQSTITQDPDALEELRKSVLWVWICAITFTLAGFVGFIFSLLILVPYMRKGGVIFFPMILMFLTITIFYLGICLIQYVINLSRCCQGASNTFNAAFKPLKTSFQTTSILLLMIVATYLVFKYTDLELALILDSPNPDVPIKKLK